jgi:aspartate aminotransferase-like enzyme
VDRFDDENTYLIAVRGRQLLAMIAVRGTRPFSLDLKLPDLESYLPAGRRLCELRLLAVDPSHRAGPLLHRLLARVWRYCLAQGHDAALISATTRQLKLYRHLGFEAFGPLLGSGDARFQPMLLTLERALPRAGRLFQRGPHAAAPIVNLLPGPVGVHQLVGRALAATPDSHRSPAFCADLAATKARLSTLTGARHVAILIGSGTLANDAIAAQLSIGPAPGLILSNGEFGERLVAHAAGFGLRYDVLRRPWGAPLDLEAVACRLTRSPVGWVWAVHVETSTGVLNDVEALKALCRPSSAKLCVDAISSIGLVPLDLRDVYFASGVSGKGLGAFPGLALVFYNHDIRPSEERVPRYLDLGMYAGDGVPFTHSSNLLRALQTSIGRVDWERRFRIVAERSAGLRARLRERGFDVVAADGAAAPGIVTIALPAAIGSVGAGCELERVGFAVACHSTYLRDRNWIQISLMGRPSRRQLDDVVDALHRICEGAVT